MMLLKKQAAIQWYYQTLVDERKRKIEYNIAREKIKHEEKLKKINSVKINFYHSDQMQVIQKHINGKIPILCGKCGDEIGCDGILDPVFPERMGKNRCGQCRGVERLDNYFVFHPAYLEKIVSCWYKFAGEFRRGEYTIGGYCPYCLEEFEFDGEDEDGELLEHIEECSERKYFLDEKDKEMKYHRKSCDTCDRCCWGKEKNKLDDCKNWVEMVGVGVHDV